MNEEASESDEGMEGLFDDLEVRIHRAVLRREQSRSSYPDQNALELMEEPLRRLTGATELFIDVTMLRIDTLPLSPMGLSFLADAMNREALRLFRLFHGHPPRSPQ